MLQLQCMQRPLGAIVASARTAARNFSSNIAASVPRVEAADARATSELLQAEQPFVLLGKHVATQYKCLTLTVPLPAGQQLTTAIAGSMEEWDAMRWSAAMLRERHGAHPTDLQTHELRRAVSGVGTVPLHHLWARCWARWARGCLHGTGATVVPVERSEGGADYRDAFSGSNSKGASFEADVPMTLAALLDQMEQRSKDVLSGSIDRG